MDFFTNEFLFCDWLTDPESQREIYGGNCIERKKQGSSHGTFSLPIQMFFLIAGI